MSHNQHGASTDEYGNPIHTHGTTGTAGAYPSGPGAGLGGDQGGYGGQLGGGHHGTGRYDASTIGTGVGGQHGVSGTGTGVGGGGDYGVGHGGDKHHGVTGRIHRTGSGSSSSSSSEDDGYGGRRKKGMKEKIKEKLPGGGRKGDYGSSATTAGTGNTPVGQGGYYQGGEHQEKKGMLEKIKDKLPGGGGGSH